MMSDDDLNYSGAAADTDVFELSGAVVQESDQKGAKPYDIVERAVMTE